MSVTREELAAYADGELDAARAAEVAVAVAADPELKAQVEAHRALKAKLGAHFAPILDAPLPERLTARLQRHEAEVIDFGAARNRRIARWSWIAAPALAASLALAVFMPRGDSGYASGDLAETLDTQLVAAQPADSPTRILLSFRDQAGSYCRAFAAEAQSGIACRDAEGWRLVTEGEGASAQASEYRMAGNSAAEVLERAQAMATGPALDAGEERAAKARGWR
jgi:hypothetical protein